MAKRWSNGYIEEIEGRILSNFEKEDDRRDRTTKGRGFPNLDRLPIGIGRQIKASIMFLDICDFSSRSCDDEADQVDVLTVLNIFMPEMMRIVGDYEGIVEKNTGDGLLAYFGSNWYDPKDKVRLSLEAAMTMHFANDNFISPYLMKRELEPVQFRIGIDFGKVTIAKVGNPYGVAPFVAIGTTANIACRLLGAAQPNDILIGGAVYSSMSSNYKRHCKKRDVDLEFIWGKKEKPYPVFEYFKRRQY